MVYIYIYIYTHTHTHTLQWSLGSTYLVECCNESSVAVEGGHHEGVVLLVNVQHCLDIHLRVLQRPARSDRDDGNTDTDGSKNVSTENRWQCFILRQQQLR